MVLRIIFLSCLNSQLNLLDTVRERKTVTRMKVDRNKGIYPDFVRNVLGGCRDDYGDLPLVDPSMHLLM